MVLVGAHAVDAHVALILIHMQYIIEGMCIFMIMHWFAEWLSCKRQLTQAHGSALSIRHIVPSTNYIYVALCLHSYTYVHMTIRFSKVMSNLKTLKPLYIGLKESAQRYMK